MFYRKKNNSDYDWESVLIGLPFSVYWKSKSGHYLNGNLSFAEFLGVSSIEEIIGRTDEEIGIDKKEQEKITSYLKFIDRYNSTISFLIKSAEKINFFSAEENVIFLEAAHS